MRKSPLPIIVFLLLYVLSIAEAGAQDIFVGCNRTTIESFPEQEKRPVLLYLDQSRKVADEFVRLLAEGKFDEIYNLNKMVRIYVHGDPNIEMDLATFEQKQGRITHFEYRNQEIAWQLATELDLRETVVTWYSVKTTRTKSGLVSLQVSTSKKRDEQKSLFEHVFYKDWSEAPPLPRAPSWLSKAKPAIERGSCPTMNGSLKVKAP